MTPTRSLAASLVSFSAAAVLALVGAGGATAASSVSGDKSSQSVTSAATDSTGTADYWTPDRMLAAISGDVLADAAVIRGNTSSAISVEKGPATKVKGIKGKPPIANRETPVDHIGKVFFSIGTTNYVCSGNAVSSANQSTVVTAGHCVNEGGAFVTNFAFIPAYDNGNAPYGKWTAKALYAPAQWSGSGDMQYDTGFAVMNQLNGKNLTNVVGGSGVIFNQARGLQYTAYGYPQASPFNGRSLFSCTGTATNDTNNPQFNTQGIPCDMTGGSSGGPWFIGSAPDGLQNSINSYGYGGSAVMYGPYWGTVIQDAYFAAAA